MKTELHEVETGFELKISGRLDLEKTTYLKEIFKKEFTNKHITFDLKNLSFVGSNGILYFFQTLEELYAAVNMKSKVVGLNPDFNKIIPFSNYSNIVFENVQIQSNL